MKVHRGTSADAPHKREPTYYEILGAAPASSFEQLHSKFKALAVLWHPDRATTDAEAVRCGNIYATITQAYSVLKDGSKRSEYDARLALLPGACMFCQGRGLQTKQQGFAKRTQQLCERCNGSGRADGGLCTAQIWGLLGVNH